MILTENRNILSSQFPMILEAIDRYETKPENSLKVQPLETRSGLPTLTMIKDGIAVYLHSKYDPAAEAKKLVDAYPNLEQYRHVIFYGLGLGYHLEECMKNFPAIEYTIIEPSIEILIQYLSHKLLRDLPIHSLKHIWLDTAPGATEFFLSDFLQNRRGEVLLLALPSYERAFNEAYQRFLRDFTKIVNMKRLNMHTSLAYQQKWTTNCMQNLPKLIRTPSFLQSARDAFWGKPAVIVAAGPSVMDDLENLRRIKENKLAYIFAAGSGLHPLLNAGIIPDAICIYDPNDNNIVFKPVDKKDIASLPLIFGSSVGFAQIDEYPGPKLHFLLNQDPLAVHYLKRCDDEPLRFIMDQPTISGVILQLLFDLGSNPIVFTGQNLGYRNSQVYAPGISYYDSQLTEEKLVDTFFVEDVYGGQMLTNVSYRMMRENLELLIAKYPNYKVINATKGGAKINGTIFMPLEEVIGQYWREPVVSDAWLTNREPAYDRTYLIQQNRKMEVEYQAFQKTFFQLLKLTKDLPDPRIKGNQLQANTALVELNKKFKKMTSNRFFGIFIAPQRQVELEILAQKTGENQLITDEAEKVGQLLDLISQFILRCQPVVNTIEPVYQQFQKALNESGCSDV